MALEKQRRCPSPAPRGALRADGHAGCGPRPISGNAHTRTTDEGMCLALPHPDCVASYIGPCLRIAQMKAARAAGG